MSTYRDCPIIKNYNRNSPIRLHELLNLPLQHFTTRAKNVEIEIGWFMTKYFQKHLISLTKVQKPKYTVRWSGPSGAYFVLCIFGVVGRRETTLIKYLSELTPVKQKHCPRYHAAVEQRIQLQSCHIIHIILGKTAGGQSYGFPAAPTGHRSNYLITGPVYTSSGGEII